MGSDLSFNCSYCNFGYKDELELLDEDVPHHIKCENCDQQFCVLLKECMACNAELIFVWRAAPTPEEITLLQCHHCSKAVQTVEGAEIEE